MPGYPGGGIRTFEQLADRCIRTDNGCLIWRGAKNNCGTPQAWYPTLGRVLTVSSIAYHLMHGKRPPSNLRYVAICGEPNCMVHRKLKTVSEILTGTRTAVHTAKLNRINREMRAKLTQEAVIEIRASEEKGRALAKKYGVSETTISRVRLGTGWKSIAIPGSSIFNLGG